jgi:cytochrome c2
MNDKSVHGIFAHGLPWGAGAGLAVLAFGGLLTMAPFQARGQDVQSGQALFEKRCTGCHALDGDHEGPRLRGVVGRMTAAVKTFKYSTALEKAGITWDEGKLDTWLSDPDSLIPDNDMSFRVPKKEERALIIAYLKSLH